MATDLTQDTMAWLEASQAASDEWLERLADLEHKRWAGWQRHLHKLCTPTPDGSLVIPAERVNHWEGRINTSYTDLPGYSQEADRKEARKTLDIIDPDLLAEGRRLMLEQQKEIAKLRSALAQNELGTC